VLPSASRGSALALSPDDAVAVMVNRDSGSVSVFALDFPADGTAPKVTKTAEVQLGAGSEPWQVVVGPDGDTAYVVLRRDQKLARIKSLRSLPKLDGAVDVGSEPTGVALTPTGATAWVANWVDGTLTGVDTQTMAAKSTVDLNAALVATGLLGPDAKARPALAHPRSLAITNNRDTNDADEAIYVTEYYSKRTAPEASTGATADTSQEGLVYKVSLADKTVKTIALGPITDIGFRDHAGGVAGCYPNQLQSITINEGYAYVTSICASPKGPLGVFTGPANASCTTDAQCPGGAAGSCAANGKCTTNCTADAQCGANGGKCNANVCAPNVASVKTTTAPVVSVIDLATGAEATAATANLNAKFDALYASRAQADDGTRRFPAVPVDMAFVAGTGVGYVVANGADAVFRAKYDLAAKSALTEVGAPNNPFIDLNPAGIAAAASGKNPVGVQTTYGARKFMLVANDVTRNLTVVDLNTQTVAGGTTSPVVVSSSAMPAAGSKEDRVLKGKRFFDTATGRWSLKGQGWGACQSCHVDGLSDNVTWYFARGPRQSTSLDGSFSKKDPADQRIFNWTAIFDEIADFELNTRGVSGGIGAIVSQTSAPPAAGDRIDIAKLGHAGLSGSALQASDPSNPAGLAQAGILEDWKLVTEYVQTIRSPRASRAVDPAKVTAGRQLFMVDGACQGCHGGDKWTISRRFYQPTAATTGALASRAWAQPSGFPASLLPASTNRFMRFPQTNGGLDQIQCILRPVGTFNVADATAGIAELRADMATAAQGNETDGKGFNPPSLLGLSVGAPYLHGGNATSLESMFSTTFQAHHAGALAPNFLSDADGNVRAQKVEQLVHFLLSVDESTPTVAIPAPGAQGGDFCSQ
jgi:hypothetical protein